MAINDLITKEMLIEYMSYYRIFLDNLNVFFDKGFYVLLYVMAFLATLYFLIAIYVSIFKAKSKEQKFVPEKAPFITIQIPTRNELIALRCAKKCLEFDYPKDKFEILIGDDSNDKNVSKKLDEFADRYDNVRIIRRKKNIGFKPGNLQNMLKYSNGEILVIFDSDYTPEKDFLRRIVAPFIYDKTVSVVQARWNFNNPNQNLVTIMSATIGYMFHHVTLELFNKFGTSSLCGSAEAVRKKDLIDMGGWRVGSLTEDIEYSLRLHIAGRKILYLPDLECCGDAPYTPIDFYKQQMRWAYGVVSSYLIHFKDLLLTKKIKLGRKIVSFLPGIGYFIAPLISLLFIFGILSFITHTPEAFDLPKFLSETGFNILITSGLLFASIIALFLAKKYRYVLKMFVSSFSVGLVALFYVNKGIIKSFLKEPIDWFLLKKDEHYEK